MSSISRRRHFCGASCFNESQKRSLGQFFFRLQDRTLRVSAHHYKRGGATHVCFSGDSQCVLSTGADGVLACWVWNYSSTGNKASNSTLAVSYYVRRIFTVFYSADDLEPPTFRSEVRRANHYITAPPPPVNKSTNSQ